MPILLLLGCAFLSFGQGQLPGTNPTPGGPPASGIPGGAPGGAPGAGFPGASGKPNDLELVERLIMVRRDYQKTLEFLRTHYINAGDVERSKWAEEELRQYQRIPKHAFRLELDVPPPNLQANVN